MSQSIPPFVKVLLTTDGTITSMLEAWFDEPVVAQAQQSEALLPTEFCQLLMVEQPLSCIHRKTQLLGKTSNACNAMAETWIIRERLPKGILLQIEQNEAGIGQALLQSRQESLRQVLTWSYEAQTDIAERCYRVAMQGQFVMLIVERFPLSRYR